MTAQDKWLSVVGIGADGMAGLAPAAHALVAAAELLVGGERHLAFVPERPDQQRLVWGKPLLETIDRILAQRGRRVCVLASGDPQWFGAGATLAKRVPAEELMILPAPGAFSLAAARLAWALDAVDCITLHGRPLELLNLYLYRGAHILALSEDGAMPAAVAAHLAKAGFGSAEITVLENLGGAQERIISGRADAWSHARCADLNTLAIAISDGPANARVPGLDDNVFLHDGNITKREVRAVTLSRLAPLPGELLWDVGAGAGSIGIEWLRADHRNRAIAIESRESRRYMIAQNALQLGVPQLDIRGGDAPAVLEGLPAPDAIFIGGGILTDGLLERCMAALQPCGRLVANVVTLEGEAAIVQGWQKFGGELSRLGVARADHVGRFHGWHAMMPVTQWSLVKE
ncbi:precorrin-6y C5,15-methyltransferase (decarboxylating) subunit CbiE [Ferrovibrio xuzhouensis]|uniref:Precorrin-6y C5,15-methyltransferase (Decarboxylating) subunit CbiE n=1 Tax=Ferrovibrio xuzhouensis TaxID=1576914 RepID=A0ABV7VE37_9PROT